MLIHSVGDLLAYIFAPTVLVTPLGMLSVVAGTVPGVYLQKETWATPSVRSAPC